MLEREIKKYIKEQALKRDYFVRFLQWTGRKNAPDMLLLKNGLVFFVETKKPKTPKARLSQKIEFDKMRKKGVEVYLVSTKEEVDVAIQRFEELSEIYAGLCR